MWTWFIIRIFTHRSRSWTSVSPTSTCRRWMIPSARKSSPYWVSFEEPIGVSATRNVVRPSSRRAAYSWNRSRRGNSKFASANSASMESRARIWYPFADTASRTMSTMIATQSFVPSAFFREVRRTPRSRTYSFPSSIESKPIRSIAIFRDSVVCSRVMYSPRRPSFALWYMML